jgi:hypothetical protein
MKLKENIECVIKSDVDCILSVYRGGPSIGHGCTQGCNIPDV